MCKRHADKQISGFGAAASLLKLKFLPQIVTIGLPAPTSSYAVARHMQGLRNLFCDWRKTCYAPAVGEG
jgi:hypothetical protein